MTIERPLLFSRVLGVLGASLLFSSCSPAAPPATHGAAGAFALGAHEAATPSASAVRATAPSTAIEAWWAYDRAASYEVASAKVRVPVRDGTMLDCTLSRPARGGAAAPGEHPGLVVELTPYLLQAEQYQKEASFFVRRGYNTLVCLLRGIGASGGTWQHPFAAQDGRDARDLVEWLAVQPFSNGRIGAFGESYGGATTYGAAVEQAPHLRAIAPLQSPGTLYDDVHYPGGIETAAWGPMNFWPPLAQLMSFGAVSAIDEYALYRAHPTYDAFWQERSFRGRYERIRVPVLAMGGWTDNFFRSGTLSNIEPLLARTWTFYGQWVHTIPVDLGTCDTQCAPDPLPGGVLLAWFDRWVMGLPDSPVPEQPTFLSEEGPREGGRGWQALSAWSPQEAHATRYELGSDAVLAERATVAEPVTFREPGDVTRPGSSLTFTTLPLADDRVLLGRAVLSLRAELSAPDANFYVQLLDVGESGAEAFVNDGFLKASHRTSHTAPSPVSPGEALDYRIEVRPQHYRFQAGHRVRARIWGGATDTLVQPSRVDVTVHTGSASTLTLPGFASWD
ncbi:MAG: CocE/NonD family hydrolase [Polyangiales bacterium]